MTSPAPPAAGFRKPSRLGQAGLVLFALALFLALSVVACRPRAAEAWYASGVKRYEGRMRADRRHGEWTFWYPDGTVREHGRYDDGVRVGIWTQWHPGGQRYSRGERRLDPETGASARVGTWVFLQPGGRRHAEGEFDPRGRRHGEWRFFGSRGQEDAARSGRYVEGRLVR